MVKRGNIAMVDLLIQVITLMRGNKDGVDLIYEATLPWWVFSSR
jgi:hypothetical protein